MNYRNFILASIFIFIAAFSRLIPHPPNVTPVAALALFGGFYLKRKYFALLLPIIALFLSDLIINNTISRAFYPDTQGFVFFSPYMIPVYISFVLTGVLGLYLSRKSALQKIFMGTLLASVVFFIITNFGSWLSSPVYPKNWLGLTECYIAAIPFFGLTLIGNLIFVSLLVVSFEWVRSAVLKPDFV